MTTFPLWQGVGSLFISDLRSPLLFAKENLLSLPFPVPESGVALPERGVAGELAEWQNAPLLPGNLRATVVMAGGGDRLHLTPERWAGRGSACGSPSQGTAGSPRELQRVRTLGPALCVSKGDLSSLWVTQIGRSEGARWDWCSNPGHPLPVSSWGPLNPSAHTAVKVLSLCPRALVQTV